MSFIRGELVGLLGDRMLGRHVERNEVCFQKM